MLLQDIEQSSLCYTVGPCWLSVSNIAACTCQSRTMPSTENGILLERGAKKSLDILNMVLSPCRNSLRSGSKLLSLFVLLQGHNKITCLKKTESSGPNYLLLLESYIIYLCGGSDL